MSGIPAFNFVDAIAAVILLVGVLGGLKRGLSGELSRVIGIGVAAFAAWRFAGPVAEWAMQQLSLGQDRSYVFSFIAILAAGILVMWVVRVVLRNLMEFAFKGRIERIGGALAGLLRSAVIVAAILLMIGYAPQAEIQAMVMEKSFFGRLVNQYLRPVYENIQQSSPDLGLPAPENAEEADLGENTDEESYGEDDPPATDVLPP